MTSNTNSLNYQPTQHSLIIGGANSTISSLGVATNGQIPIGSTGADPSLATLTAGTNVSITNGAGSITVNSSAPATAPSTLTLTQFDMVDDFIYSNAGISTSATQLGPWTILLSGTGASLGTNNGTAVSNAPGYVTISTGTTNTGACGIALYNSAFDQFTTSAGAITFQALVYIPTLSNGTNRYTLRIGLMTSVTGVPGSGMWFEYVDNVNSGNWVINCKSNGGVLTSANTSTAAASGAYHNYKITTNSAGTSVAFFIDGTQVANSPIATNIPTTATPPGVSIIKSVGTSASNVQLDLITLNEVFGTPRPG